MSSTKPPREGLAPDLPSDVRALSPRPNLEHERKQAKQLLDQLKAGDREALARLRKHKHDSSGSFQLAAAHQRPRIGRAERAKSTGILTRDEYSNYAVVAMLRHSASGASGRRWGRPRPIARRPCGSPGSSVDARTTADQRKHDLLAPLHVFHALIQRASRPVLEIIEAAGGSKERLLPKIERTLNDW